ncbi:hypothetical protein PJE062_4038 [Pseudovibrio sp. JE062]|nr:hypothetical protein PJE062_4038 [Pseudovibrio sp. JE062]
MLWIRRAFRRCRPNIDDFSTLLSDMSSNDMSKLNTCVITGKNNPFVGWHEEKIPFLEG